MANTLNSLIEKNINIGLGDHTAIYFQDEEITYSQLVVRINRVGNAFKELGISVDDRVSLILDDTPDFVVCFLALLKIGSHPVIINTFLKSNDYDYIIKNCMSRAVVLDKNKLDNLSDLISRLSKIKWIIPEITSRQGVESLGKMSKKSSDKLESVNVEDNRIDFFLYTSGTTGEPKGVAHRQRDMLFCHTSYGKSVLGISEADRTFSASKLFFAYGLQHNLALPFSAGAGAILFSGKPTPSNIFKILSKYRPSLFFAVPTVYRNIFSRKNSISNKSEFKNVRLCISAGEPLPSELLDAWRQRYGKEIIDGIGCTESLSDFMINIPGKIKKNSCGYLVKGYREKIVDKKSRRVPPGTIGTLLIKNRNISPFYLDKNGKLKKTTVKGWFNTGDRFSKHKDGYYTYHGRSDDMMKVEGLWVSPIEIERVLMSHPAVLECAVVPALMKDKFIKPKAVVVHAPWLIAGLLINRKEGLIQELKEFLKNKVSSYKVPAIIVFVSSLPKTTTGKVLRYKLRDTHER